VSSLFLSAPDSFTHSEAIHDEWTRSVLADRPDIKPEQLGRTRSLMNLQARDALVEGYESLISTLSLPDPDDRHVLAAAVHAGASAIITFNLTDFPAERLAPYGVQAQHPDELVCQLIDEAPALACAAAKRQRESLKKPPKSAEEYLAVLGRVGLPKAAEKLRSFSGLI
jgi:hypothetical protein